MPAHDEIEAKFWKTLKADRTVMLGLNGVDLDHAQPMTAMTEDDDTSIWFFTAKDTDLVKALGRSHPAVMNLVAKNHQLFATVHGELVIDNDRHTIDRLWNPFVAAWFEGGKDDPNLQMIRFDPDRAQIWLNDSSLLAGVKLLLKRDPKVDYRHKVAEVRL
jgi:general stress protein 26